MIASGIKLGLHCSAVGVACGLLVWQLATGSGYHLFWLYAGLAAFITAAGLWMAVMGLLNRRREAAGRRPSMGLVGAIVGGLSGALAHPLCWFLQILAMYICFRTTGGCVSSLGEPPMDPLTALWASWGFSFFSLIFFGWITVPAGALIGFLHGRRLA